MANRLKGITVEIGGDTTGLTQALSGVNKEIRGTQSQLRDVNRLLKLDPDNSELLAQKQKLLADSISETKQKLTQLKSVQDQMDEGLKNGTVTQEQYDAWQREIAATESALKNLESQTKTTQKSISETLVDAGNQTKAVGEKISGAGESLSKGLTVPLGAIGTASLAAFKDVDNGLDIVEQKTGATGKALEGMNQNVKNLATSIPTDFETAGQAVGEVNTRFGLTGQTLEDLSGKFIKFASLNDTDVSNSVDNVSQVLNAFGESSHDAGDLLDALNATGQSTGISMDTLAKDLASNATQFKQMGLNAKQASGFMGAVEMSGMDTSTAMAGLKKAMKNASDDGQSLDTVLKGFSETMSSNKSDTEKLSASYDLFGTKAGAAIYNAVSSGKLNLSDLSSTLGDFKGSVENTFNETVDPIDQFQMTLNSLKVVGADVGNSLATVLAPMLKELANWLKSASDAWNSLSPEMQNFIVQVGLVLAILGPALVIIGKVVSAVGTILTVIPKVIELLGTLKSGMSVLFGVISANPIGALIVSIGLLVTAFLYLWNNCESFRKFWIGVWNTIKSTATSALNGLSSFFQTIWSTISGIFRTSLTGIQSLVSSIFHGISSTVSNVTTGISHVISSVMGTIKSTISSVWSTIKTTVGSLTSGIASGVSSTFGRMASGVSSVIGNIKSTIIAGFNEAIQFITSLPARAKKWGTDLIDGIVSGIKSCIGKVKDAVGNVANTIKSFLHFSVPDQGPLSDYQSWMPDFMKGLAQGIEKHKEDVSEAMKDVAQEMDLSSSLKRPSLSIASPASDTGTITFNQPIMLDGRVMTTVVSEIMYANGQAKLRNKGMI